MGNVNINSTTNTPAAPSNQTNNTAISVADPVKIKLPYKNLNSPNTKPQIPVVYQTGIVIQRHPEHIIFSEFGIPIPTKKINNN